MSDTVHILGLPHTATTAAYASCAYTQRVTKLCRMLTGEGRRVLLYGSEENEAPCDEHIPLLTEKRRQEWFGAHDEADLNRGGFDWNPQSPWWSETNARAVGEISKRMEPTDLLCLTAGLAQGIVAQALPALTVAEVMVGYEGILVDRRNAFAAFESHTHRHLVYGLNGWRRAREYDTVIPNSFDPTELPEGPGAGGYLLFVGRLIGQKGIHTACLVADALNMPIRIAGPGATAWGDGFLEFPEGRVEARQLEYVGPVGIDERAVLMGDACVTLVPTVYVEPFGGVAVESMMCGTPVVTTDFGAFTETVQEGVSGYRFQTLQEAVDATLWATELDRQAVRDYALGRYSLDAVRPLYERWFGNLDGLWGEGWTALRDELKKTV